MVFSITPKDITCMFMTLFNTHLLKGHYVDNSDDKKYTCTEAICEFTPSWVG